MRTIFYIILLMIISIALIGCQSNQKPAVKDGKINITSIDEIVNLSGKWNFYPQQLLSPDNRITENTHSQEITVPKYWQKDITYGTYHLHLTFHEDEIGEFKALRIPQIFSAYKLWIDDKLIVENGKVGKTEHETIARGIPETIYFTVSEPEVDLLIQVANFHYYHAGISNAIYMGSPTQITNINKLFSIVEWFCIGALLVISFTQLTIFWNRKEDVIFLYFGLFCLFIGLRVLFVGQSYIFYFFPHVSWETAVKANYILLFISIPLFVKYVALLFSSSLRKGIFNTLVIISIITSLYIAFVGAEQASKTALILYLILIFVIPFLFFTLVKAIKNKQTGAKIIGFYLILLIATVINDLLFEEQIIDTMVMLPLGLVAYCSAQSYVLSVKYSHANLQVKSLADELEKNQKEVIFTLGQIIEGRSEETGYHVRRVAEYSHLLAIKSGMPIDKAELIKIASAMHDIGKVGIPDDILNKPGKLTEKEYEKIKEHTVIGYDMLNHSRQGLLKIAAVIAYTHHERYDGLGYPRGLKGEEIPLSGRIVAIADVFDALSVDRVYKKAWPLDKIISYFQEQKGKQFDPNLIDVFLRYLDEFLHIEKAYKDKQ